MAEKYLKVKNNEGGPALKETCYLFTSLNNFDPGAGTGTRVKK